MTVDAADPAEPEFTLDWFDTLETMPEPSMDTAGTTVFTDIEFGNSLGFRPARLDLRVPAADGPVPVVVWIHGGAFMFGSRRHGPVSIPIWDSLLRNHIAVAAVEYRMSGEAVFPACLHDVKAAVRWLRRFGAELGLRTDAIGAWGESAGGHLAAFLGLNNDDPAINGTVGVTGVSSDVQAAVAWYPPTNFRTMDAQAPADAAMPHDPPGSPESLLVGRAIQEHPEAADFASPITHVTAAAAPLLLIHGLNDRAVPYPQSVDFAAALEKAGADVRFESIPGAGHVFVGVDHGPIIERSTQFLVERLG